MHTYTYAGLCEHLCYGDESLMLAPHSHINTSIFLSFLVSGTPWGVIKKQRRTNVQGALVHLVTNFCHLSPKRVQKWSELCICHLCRARQTETASFLDAFPPLKQPISSIFQKRKWPCSKMTWHAPHVGHRMVLMTWSLTGRHVSRSKLPCHFSS